MDCSQYDLEIIVSLVVGEKFQLSAVMALQQLGFHMDVDNFPVTLNPQTSSFISTLTFYWLYSKIKEETM